jgi:thiamine biosynthesis lipoprotein
MLVSGADLYYLDGTMMRAKLPARLMVCLLAPVLALGALSSCRSGLYRETRQSMSTFLTVIVAADRPPNWESLFALADQEAARFDYRREESSLRRLNTEGNARLEPELAALLRTALDIATASGGAFDPTLLPVSSLWGFDEGGRLPGQEKIREAMAKTGYQAVSLDAGGKAALPSGFGLDLGGIAKGAVVDLLAAELLASGRGDFLIEAGGDILVSGLKEGGRPWVVAIRHPRRSDAVLGLLRLGAEAERTAVVTSGDYERYFEQDGVRYHHILNPATGAPARGLVSVTVIAPTCAEADGLATAAFVLGAEAGLRLLEERAHVEGLLVVKGPETDGRLTARVTSGFPLAPADLALDD